MYYFGMLNDTGTVEVFYSKIIPTSESHGNFYDFTFGGYSTRNEAIQKAGYQYPYAKIVNYDGRKRESKISHCLYAIAKIA